MATRGTQATGQCCFQDGTGVGCGRLAEWTIVRRLYPSAIVEGCGEHIAALLDHQLENRVTFTRPAPPPWRCASCNRSLAAGEPVFVSRGLEPQCGQCYREEG